MAIFLPSYAARYPSGSYGNETRGPEYSHYRCDLLNAEDAGKVDETDNGAY